MKKTSKGDVKMLVLFVVMAIAVLGLVLFEVFGIGKKQPSTPSESSVSQTVPSGEAEDMQESKSEAYRTPGRRRTMTIDEYFGSLPEDGCEDISLVSGAEDKSSAATAGPAPSNSGSDAAARVFGTPPTELGENARKSQDDFLLREETKPASSGINPPTGRRVSAMTAEEKLEYDRLRAEMVRDVVTGGSASEAAAAETSEDQTVASPEAEPLTFSTDPGDGIISSLDDDYRDSAIRYADDVKRPFRCMFVRNEKLKNGQRVTLRLLEEYNADGIRIPANTHLQAICKLQDRLTLSVRSFEINGRIIPLQLEAYDTDGLVGIYCPDASRASKTATNDAISAAGTTFGGLVGDLANTVLRTGATIARSANGEVSVSVNSGYQFYLVKAERK